MLLLGRLSCSWRGSFGCNIVMRNMQVADYLCGLVITRDSSPLLLSTKSSAMMNRQAETRLGNQSHVVPWEQPFLAGKDTPEPIAIDVLDLANDSISWEGKLIPDILNRKVGPLRLCSHSNAAIRRQHVGRHASLGRLRCRCTIVLLPAPLIARLCRGLRRPRLVLESPTTDHFPDNDAL